MANIRPEVKRFMREFETLFGFAGQNGGLTEDECDALKYYCSELTTHVLKFCSAKDEK